MGKTLVSRLVGVALVLGLAVPGALVLANAGAGSGPVVSPGVRLVASAPPVADLVLNPPTGVAPVVLTADGSGSTDDIGVMSYAFGWGDGTSSPAEIEPTRSHTYTTPGSYVVALTVTDADGGTSSTSKTLVVTSDPTPPPDAPPTARVSVSPASGQAPLNVDIDGGTSSDDRGIESYQFSFGDGSSTVAQPSSTVEHSYTTAGTFTIRLTVTDTGGQTSVATTSLTVSAPPPPTPTPPTTRPVTVSFTFDDTFADQIPAAGVLDEFGMDGTFYVNSPRLGATAGTYMSRSQATALQAAGHEIGGHTLGHVDLDTVSATEVRHQVCDDRTALSSMGFAVTSFAYPFGSTSPTAKQTVADCGYTSGRGVGNLRSPGYGCNSCATAETIPPADRWQIGTNTSVQSDTTVDMLKQYVTQAENDQGGWVPLVFHHICTGCASNAIELAKFRTFVQWLAQRPGPTQVRTVHQTIGGPTPTVTPTVTPTTTTTATPTGPPGTNPTGVTAGAQSHALTGTNIARTTGALVRYMAPRTTTGTNQYGTEVSVVNGVVTAVQTSVGNMAIPAGGYVLSGHGESGTWLKTYATVGTRITLTGGSTTTPTTPTTAPTTPTTAPTTPTTAPTTPTTAPTTPTTAPTTPTTTATSTATATTVPNPTTVTIGTRTHVLTGTNIARTTGALVRYMAPRTTTGTNQYGTEVSVVNGVVTAVQTSVGNMAIPAGGYVLSGHSESNTWLKTYATVGTRITLS